MHLLRQLEGVSELVREAGRAILEVKVEALATPTEKAGGQGPVTAADLAADRVVRAGLARLFPDDVVITEETWTTGTDIAHADRVWFVDPLDGTADFLAGRPDYAVQVGLCVRGTPVLGFIYQPETETLWRGIVAPDERRCERVDADGTITRLNVDRTAKLSAPPRVAVSASHPTALAEFVVKELGGIAIPRGSVGIKVGMIVDGLADMYVSNSRYIKVWDTAGPSAVLVAAHGEMASLLGQPLAYDGSAAHIGGVRAWTPAARGSVEPTLRRVAEGLRPQLRAPA